MELTNVRVVINGQIQKKQIETLLDGLDRIEGFEFEIEFSVGSRIWVTHPEVLISEDEIET